MPRSIACASSRAHIIGSTHATCGLTAKPPGTQRSLATISRYSSTQALASSGSTNEKLSAPIPFSAARRIVSRREHATHNGGGGRFARQRQDPEAQADALRALRGGAEEDARGARVRVLLEEVVLDLPYRVQADAVGDLDLLEGVLDEPVLAVVAPRARELMLIEDAEAH